MARKKFIAEWELVIGICYPPKAFYRVQFYDPLTETFQRRIGIGCIYLRWGSA